MYLIGGPNGAGKTTTALKVLPALGCNEFVNADSIAAGLSPFDPESSAIHAGRLMLGKIKTLRSLGSNFAFESTLASRTFANFITHCKNEGYRFHLIFIWLPTVEIAIQRVKSRVINGGHNIPKDVITRRYYKGISNFFNLYLPLANTCMIFDNSKIQPELIAELEENQKTRIYLLDSWNSMKDSVAKE